MFKMFEKVWKKYVALKYVVLNGKRVIPKEGDYQSQRLISELWNEFRGSGHHWYDCDVDEIDNVIDKVVENWDTVFMGYHKADLYLLPYHIWSLGMDSLDKGWRNEYWFTKKEVKRLKHLACELSIYQLGSLYAHTFHIKYCSYCDPEAKARLFKKSMENWKMICGKEPSAVVNLE